MPKKRETENFVRLGADLKTARKVLGSSRRALAEMVNIDPRYLANSENFPVERYFFPPEGEQDDKERARAAPARKLQLFSRTWTPPPAEPMTMTL